MTELAIGSDIITIHQADEMLLSGQEIKALGLITDAVDVNYRAASYDLSVGSIIPPYRNDTAMKGTSQGIQILDSMIIPAQGMAEVISREHVRLPSNIAGYATVRTRLCEKGILTINIGIVDPGYEGLLASTLINFGKSPFVLRRDEVFLRLTFHRFEDAHASPATIRSDEQYVRDKEHKVIQHFSPTFLNLEETIRQVAESVTQEWKKKLFIYVPVAAGVLALFAFLVTLGVSRVDRRLPLTDDIRVQVITETKAMRDSLIGRLASLEKSNKDLREALSALQTKK